MLKRVDWTGSILYIEVVWDFIYPVSIMTHEPQSNLYCSIHDMSAPFVSDVFA
jgi:hypothetical protein